MEPRIVAVEGPDKSCKTTLELTFPDPIAVFEFDINTVHRALWRFPNLIKGENFFLVQYPTPIGFGNESERYIRPIWAKFLEDFYKALTHPEIKTLAIDTASKCWWLCHTDYLQELNDAIKNKPGKYKDGYLRQQLLPVEYGEPNDRMSSLIYGARQYGKNLILTHHLRDVYMNKLVGEKVVEYKTGEYERDGFKSTGKLVDYAIRMVLEKNGTNVVPSGTITLSGLSLNLFGKTIQSPTYEKIEQSIQAARTMDLGE